MKIVLVDTPCPELWDDRLEVNLGLLYLATYLKHNGNEVKLVDLRSMPEASWKTMIPSDGDIYGFSTYTPTYHITVKIAKIVSEVNENAILVAGGAHATALPIEVIKDFDYVIKGEGEKAMLKLVDSMNASRCIPRIIDGMPIQNLDEIPFPDYSLCDIDSYHRTIRGKRCLSVLFSRGCPYACAFCNSIVMGAGKILRFRSPENFVKEIECLNELHGIQAFRFQDDLFPYNLSRVKKIAELLRHLDITYRCFGRVGSCTREMAEALVEGGCVHISFGVESGSQRMLDLMNKRQTVQEIRNGINNAKRAGIVVRVYLIVGFPGESWESVKQTVDLMLECNPEEFIIYNLIPYPGTDVFNNPEKYGITFIDRDYSKYLQTAGNHESGYTFKTKSIDRDFIKASREFMLDKLLPKIRWAGESQGFI